MPSVTVSITSPVPCVLKHWDRLSKKERHYEIIRYVQTQKGSAISLNLHPKVGSVVSCHAQPARFLSKRINENLNSADLRHFPYLLVIEATRPEGRLHLHGVYLDLGYPKRLIHEAFRKGAGKITGRSGSRQVFSKAVYAARGWHNYILKDAAWTRRFLEAKVNLRWVSRPMTQIVRDNYETTRLGQAKVANENSPAKRAI